MVNQNQAAWGLNITTTKTGTFVRTVTTITKINNLTRSKFCYDQNCIAAMRLSKCTAQQIITRKTNLEAQQVQSQNNHVRWSHPPNSHRPAAVLVAEVAGWRVGVGDQMPREI